MRSRVLRGLTAQSLDGRKLQKPQLRHFRSILSAGSGTITAPSAYATVCEVWLTGGGGGTLASSVPGGGGGGALYKRFACAPGVGLAYSVGFGGTASPSDGGDTTLTMPNGVLLRARGGKSSANGGAGGVAENGDDNRTGGAGGNAGGGAGESPPNGGAGGSGGGSGGGGGGAAGFADYGDLGGGAGGNSGPNAGLAPGGGGSAGSAAGGVGRLVAIFARVKEP